MVSVNLLKNPEVDALGLFLFYVVVVFSVISVKLPKNLEGEASERFNRSVRFARCARSLTALARRLVSIFRTHIYILMLEFKSPANSKSLIVH